LSGRRAAPELGSVVAPAALAGGNGTALSITTDQPTFSSDGTTVYLTAAASSSSSSSPAAVLVSSDGGVNFTNVATVATIDWTGSGRFKQSPEEAITVSGLQPRTAYTVTVCFIQPGANGNPLKKACADLPITTPAPGGCDPSSPDCGGIINPG